MCCAILVKIVDIRFTQRCIENELVIAGTTDQTVIAKPAGQRVIAKIAIQCIGQGATRQHVR